MKDDAAMGGALACPKVVVVGASAGGLDAVSALLGGLPHRFPASLFIVIHTGPGGPGMLPTLISRATKLPVLVPMRSEPILPGHVYLPRPDWHLVIEDSTVRANHGPRQHGFRPAVDPLFFSAAQWYGDCCAGVILSGALSDGTAGLLAIKRVGGAAIVQNPEESAFDSMPLSALKSVEVDAVLPAADIGRYLGELIAREGHPGAPARARSPSGERGRAKGRHARVTSMKGVSEAMNQGDTELSPPTGHGELSALTCPNCGGALWEVRDNGVEQFECHVGHRFGSEALVALDDERTETALWSGVRALKENAALHRRMAARADSRGMKGLAAQWRQDATQAEARALHVRDLIERTEEPGQGAARRGRARQKADIAARKTRPPKRRRKASR